MGKHATQNAHPWRATARTVFQAFVMLCAIAPAIYAAATQGDPLAATGWAAAGLAIAGAVTRVMAVPGVEAWLRHYLPFLAAEPPAGALSMMPVGPSTPVTPLDVLEAPRAPETAVIGDVPEADEAAE